MTINKINFRSTIVSLAFGALVTVLPASADSVTFGTTATPQAVAVGAYNFTITDASSVVLNGLTTTPTALAGTSTTTSFGEVTLSLGVGGPVSSVVAIDVNPTNIDGTPVTVKGASPTATPAVFDATITSIGGGNFTVNFNGGVANGTGAYAGDYVQIENGIEYAVAATTTVNSAVTKSFFIGGLVGVAPLSTPEPATFATTGLAAAFLGLFLRRKAKQNS